MEIKSFRIRNYRSIKDSGICYTSGDNITILAGRNESGKTAILEALEDFGTEREIRKEAIPFHEEGKMPEITVTFKTGKETLKDISEESGFKIEIGKDIDVEITKKYPAEYSFSEESKNKLGITYEQLFKGKQEEIRGAHKQIKTIHSKFPALGGTLPEMNFDNMQEFQTQFKNFQKETQPKLTQITEEKNRNDFTQAREEILKHIAEVENLQSTENRLLEKIKRWIPNFILFSSFLDELPSEIPLSEAKNNDLIKDLAIIAKLDLDLITSDNPTRQIKHKEDLNITLKKGYEQFWTQDLTNLHIEWNSGKLYFHIKDEGEYYPYNIRSKGKQWHLAFYIRISARAKEDAPNIILIDEPGLYLHAKAQEDILNKLEDAADDVPIIFSTHSPYLIKTDRLSRIRLVSKTKEKGTLVSNKVHKGADKETLTPIITAIGLDLSMGLDIAKDNNIIVEGITDYYYLTAFKELLGFKFKKEAHFIPSVGADKFNFLVPLMIGWGLNYCTVLDNDEKGRRISRKLLDDFKHTGIKIISVSEDKENEIEDLFEKKDFIKNILKEDPSPMDVDKKNSQLIKQKGKNYDKALLSKLFYEKAKNGKITLSSKTQENFRRLLRNIDEVIFP